MNCFLNVLTQLININISWTKWNSSHSQFKKKKKIKTIGKTSIELNVWVVRLINFQWILLIIHSFNEIRIAVEWTCSRICFVIANKCDHSKRFFYLESLAGSKLWMDLNYITEKITSWKQQKKATKRSWNFFLLRNPILAIIWIE